jgi:hypothetical protein
MTAQPTKSIALKQLLQTRSGLIVDLLERGVDASATLAAELKVNEKALCRLLRALASQGIFEETAPRKFKNSGISHCLRKDEPGSIRPALLYWGTDFYYQSFGEILHSAETGEPARAKLFRKNEWEHMRPTPRAGSGL